MTDYLRMSAIQLADVIRTGEMTALDVVNLHVARIERVNP